MKGNIYLLDIMNVAQANLPWNKLKNKCILITGATGLIGSFIVDLLMYRNAEYKDNIKIIALCRNYEAAQMRFTSHLKNSNFFILQQDVCEPLNIDANIDYIIHGASNADPISFSKDPVGTMMANLSGTYNILNYAAQNSVTRTVFLSTGEVYGEGNGDVLTFTEDYYGYVNFNSPRACYPESKRAAETLCSSFLRQFNIDIVIARLCYVYGSTMSKKDSRVIAQFVRNAVNNEDIVMKSDGLQLRSYCYISDAVSAIICLLLMGKKGEIYNIANSNSNVTIKEIAETLAKLFRLKIRYEVPSVTERDGYSIVKQAVLNAEKIEKLGWKASINLDEGLKRTVSILREL